MQSIHQTVEKFGVLHEDECFAMSTRLIQYSGGFRSVR